MKCRLLTLFVVCILVNICCAQTTILVDTGQTNCYNAAAFIAAPQLAQPFYGQDAQYSGRQPSYKDNGDGTVSDINTGLMWIRKSPTYKYTWTDATNVPVWLNERNFAGHKDWRLPNTKELYSLINHSKGWPYIDTQYFMCELAPQIMDQVKNTQYWTRDASVTIGGRTEAFGVNFATGHIKAYAALMTSYVRCVRGNPNYGKNDFIDHANGTITDRATGLMWAKADSQKGMNWEESLAWVQAKNRENYLGYSDWRLPNVRELQSLVDYARITEPAKSGSIATALNPLFLCTPITDQEGNADCPYYWTSTSCYHGPTSPDYRFAWYVSFGRAQNAIASSNPGIPRARSRLVAEAGATRYDAKVKSQLGGGPPGSGGERIYNFVRPVRGGDVSLVTQEATK